jgi:hypothetical protein
MPWDLDEIFSYETVRLVKIKDYRLGIPHLLITIGIVLEIFVHQLIIDGGYLAKETAITGTVRLTLQGPGTRAPTSGLHRNTIQRKNNRDLSYCLDDCDSPIGDCSGDFDQEQLMCPAMYSNAAFVKYPALEGGGAAFFTTRVDSVTEQLDPSCHPTATTGFATTGSLLASTQPGCYQWNQTANASWYISQLEDFLVKIDHSMLAPHLLETKSSYGMQQGALLAFGEHEVGADDPDTIDPCEVWRPFSSRSVLVACPLCVSRN